MEGGLRGCVTRGVAVLLGVLLLAPALALPAGAEIQQRDYNAARDDTSIFLALLVEATDAAESGLLAGAEGNGAGVQQQARELSSLMDGFSDELLEIIARYGTAPVTIQTIQAEANAFNDAAQRVAKADEALRLNRSIASSTPPGPERGDHLVLALQALARERGALADLRTAAAAFERRGVDIEPLLAAADALEAALLSTRSTLESEAARLELPALLILSLDRRRAELGTSFVASGLAFVDGRPAVGERVQIEFAGRTLSGTVGVEGRYEIPVRVPLSMDPGPYPILAKAALGGTPTEVGPEPLEVLPVQSTLTLEFATTTPGRGNSLLTYLGRLGTGPYPAADRPVELVQGGRVVSSTVTDAEGRFEASVDLSSLGEVYGVIQFRAVFQSDNPRLSDAESPPTEILWRTNPHGQAIFQEFIFTTTGLGLIADLLMALTIIGASVFVYSAFLSGEAQIAVRQWRVRSLFRKLVKFNVATAEDKARADPRNAFPPDDDLQVGPLYAEFLQAIKRFEPLPKGITPGELANRMIERGVDPSSTQQVLAAFQEVAYGPPERRGPRDAATARARLVELWRGFLASRGSL